MHRYTQFSARVCTEALFTLQNYQSLIASLVTFITGRNKTLNPNYVRVDVESKNRVSFLSQSAQAHRHL